MTVENDRRVIRHIGDGVTTEFPYDFYIPDADSIEVYLYDSDTGLSTLIDSALYDVTGLGDEDFGEVTYPLTGSPIPATQRLIVFRTVGYVQGTSIRNQAGFYPAVLEAQLDKIVFQIQQVAEEVSRAIKAPEGDAGANLDMTLPSAGMRASGAFHFDSSGEPSIQDPTNGSGTSVVPTGATTQLTLAELFAFELRPEMFGAMCNGIVDDGLAIKEATSVLSARGGGLLRFAAGKTYHCLSVWKPAADPAYSYRVATPDSNITFYGEPGATLKMGAGMSTSFQWNFFVRIADEDLENIWFHGLVFDFNGANNKVPAAHVTNKRHCLGVWLIHPGLFTGHNERVTSCRFKNNPGTNSISIIDDDGVGTKNKVEDVWIVDNDFDDFGWTIDNGTNTVNTDHSCMYVQARRALVLGNRAKNSYASTIGSARTTCMIDWHSECGQVHGNSADNMTMFLTNEANAHTQENVSVMGNVTNDIEIVNKPIDNGVINTFQNFVFHSNVFGLKPTANNFSAFDLSSGLAAASTLDNYSINNNYIYWDGVPADFANRTCSALVAKRGTGLEFNANRVQNCPGIPVNIVSAATVNMTGNFDLNRLIAYGRGGVAGQMKGMLFDMDGGGAGSRMYARWNTFDSGDLLVREHGVYFTGAMAILEIYDNTYRLAGVNVGYLAPFGANQWRIERGVLMYTEQKNFAAPAAVPGITTVSMTLTGARIGDKVEVSADIARPAGFIGPFGTVEVNDAVVIYWAQLTGGAPVDPDGVGGAFYEVTLTQRL